MAAKMRKRKRPLKRKSAKANKKLMTIIGLITAVLVTGAGTAWFFLEYKGAQRNINNGNKLVAEGKFRQAEKQYGRAINKDHSNLTYVDKWRETLLLITPVTPSEASAFYNKYISALQTAARYNPLDIDTQLKLVEELYKAAHLTGADFYWNQVEISAQSGLDRISENNPRRHELVLYDALATLHLDDKSMTDTYNDEGMIRFPGEDKIEEVLESDPSNAVAWAALAHGRMAVFHRLTNQGRTQAAARSRIFADETMQDAIEIAGGGLEIAETQLREMLLRRTAMLQRYILDKTSIGQGELDAVGGLILIARDGVIAAYDPKLHYHRTGELIRLIRATGEGGMELLTTMLRDHVRANPNDLGRQFSLAKMLQFQGFFDESTEVSQGILDMPPLKTSLYAMDQFDRRPQAAQLLVELATAQYSFSEGEDREAYLEDAKRYREVLADLVSQKSDNLLLVYADGLIALKENRFRDAALLLEDLILRNPGVGTQVYREVADALARSGAIGLAHERLEVVLEREPGIVGNYINKARIDLMISDVESAAATLSQLSEKDRERPEILQLLDEIAMKQKGGDTRFTDPILSMIAISERATALGKFEDAKTILTDGIEQVATPDWRLYAAMSIVYISNQEMKEAAVWVRKALEVDPDNQMLRNLLLVIESEDEVAAQIAVIEAMEIDSVEKAELITLKLFTMATRKRREAERWAAMGDTDKALIAKSLGDRAMAESNKYQIKAEAAGADMSNITLIQFDQALTGLEMDLASELIERLSSLSVDTIVIDGTKVRLLLAKASIAKDADDNLGSDVHANKALVIAKKMVNKMAFSDHSWLMVGLSYSALEQHEDALTAFEEAWRISPNSKENIRRYIASLIMTKSDPQRRLRIVRSAREKYPKDEYFRSLWLLTEKEIGNKWEVLVHRTEEYKIHPDDNQNALELALLLVNTEPRREFIRNADGTEAYSARNWNQMQNEQKSEVIQKVRESWDAKVDEIVVKLDQQEDINVKMAWFHASLVRDLGQLDHASDIWDRFLKSREGTESYVNAVVSAADFLRLENRVPQALSMLRDAIEKIPDQFVLRGALGAILYEVQRYEEAAPFLAIAAVESGADHMYSMWIESLIYSSQFDEANRVLNEDKTGSTAYGKAMLYALISRVKSETLLAQGNIVGGTAELASYRNHLQLAINARPTLSNPYIRLANSLLSEYRLTQNKSLLEESLQIVELGSRKIENQVQFAVIRADVLQADGQLHRAVDRLNQYLAKQPSADLVRSRLVDAYLDMDNLDKAIRIAKDGIEVDPTNPMWYQRVGDLHLRLNDDRAEAVKVFIAALKRNPNVHLLLLIDTITRTKQLLPNKELLSLVQGNFSNLHPISASIEAKVLKNLGRTRDALLAMEKSWDSFETSIANSWLPPSASAPWYLDLRELFDEDPSAGEEFIHKLAGTTLSEHQLAGLAGYWKAFGDEHIDKAILIIRNALVDTEPGSNARIQLLTVLGAYLVDAGRFEESESTFRKLSEEHDSPIVLNNLAYVVGVYLNKPEEGLVLAREAVMKMPREPAFVDTIATLHQRTGDYKTAAETLEYLLQIDPARATAMSQLSILYSEYLEQPERGVVYAERARSQTPRSPEVLDALGWSYYQTGRTATGEEYLLNSLKRGETMDAYIHLSQVVMSRSEHDKALGYLRMAQELAKDEYSLNRIKVLQDDIRKAKSLLDM